MKHKKISRPEAKRLGLTRYFTGKPCKRGHVVERQVYNHSCVACLALADKSPAGKARHSRYVRSGKAAATRKRWRNTSSGRKKYSAVRRRYRYSPKGQDTIWRRNRSTNFAECCRRWRESPLGAESRWRYNQSPKGHERAREHQRTSRARELKNAGKRRRRLAQVRTEYLAHPTQHNYNRLMRCRG